MGERFPRNLREGTAGDVAAPCFADAVALADQGYYVFPLRANRKEPAIRKWAIRAASNEVALGRIWREESNIGIACGPSNIAVLDVDPRNGGNDSWEQLASDIGAENFQGIPTVQTPGGGMHYYFSQPPERIGSAANVLPGVDVRGDGGYVVAPPSFFAGDDTHNYHGSYSWVIRDGLLRPFPLTVLRYRASSLKPLKSNGTGSGLSEPRQTAQPWSEGVRNMKLTSLAGALVNRGFSESDLHGILQKVNQTRCVPPLDESEIDGIARSASRGFDRRFDDRFTYLAAWQERGIHGKALELLFIIARCANRHGIWAPNRKQLMEALGTRVPDTMYAAREELREAGALSIEERGNALSTILRLNWPIGYGLRAA